MAAWTLFNVNGMLESCLMCEVSDTELSGVGLRRGGSGGKKLSSKTLAMSSEFVTCEPALSLTLTIGENESLTA